ncbi:hypothetical protein DFH08DRAFT_797363 [Mycena albidolilacea]|uniref:Uncharacterized protein n=1 Tax=Mycena albidolilacea TaxID=1033008 RepID=A0AAD7ARC9_9AGAR|nr:hypothetical protein DFH08DRAFT_797363 [Mycena albidolilacea]
MNYEFYNSFAFSTSTPASSERGHEFEDRAKKRVRLSARMRRRAISSSAINSIAVVAASLDQWPPLIPPVFRLHPGLMLLDFARCEPIPVDLHAYWHEANGALLNVPSEDLDVCVPDAPNLDIEPADVDTEEQDPVSSVSAPVAAISEPITEVDSVNLDHSERALDTAESRLSTAVSASATTSSPSNIITEGEGNVGDGKGKTYEVAPELVCTPASLSIDSPPLVRGVNQFLLCIPNQWWMGSTSVQDNNDKKMVTSLGTASKKSNAVQVKDKTLEVTPELVCTPALPSIGSPPLVQGVNQFLLYVSNQWWMGSTSGQDSDNTVVVASIGMGALSTAGVGAASKTNVARGNERGIGGTPATRKTQPLPLDVEQCRPPPATLCPQDERRRPQPAADQVPIRPPPPSPPLSRIRSSPTYMYDADLPVLSHLAVLYRVRVKSEFLPTIHIEIRAAFALLSACLDLDKYRCLGLINLLGFGCENICQIGLPAGYEVLLLRLGLDPTLFCVSSRAPPLPPLSAVLQPPPLVWIFRPFHPLPGHESDGLLIVRSDSHPTLRLCESASTFAIPPIISSAMQLPPLLCKDLQCKPPG